MKRREKMAVLFGILSIVGAIVVGGMFGIIGGIVAVVFAILAIVFAVKKIKEGGKGVGSIILAVLGVIIGLIISSVYVFLADEMVKDARQVNATLIEESAPALKFGIVGLVIDIGNKNVNLDQFKDELDRVNKLVNEKSATEAQ